MYADFKSGFLLVLPSKKSRGCTFYPSIWPHLENSGFYSAKRDENRMNWRTVNNWSVWANYSWAHIVCLNLFAALGWFLTNFFSEVYWQPETNNTILLLFTNLRLSSMSPRRISCTLERCFAAWVLPFIRTWEHEIEEKFRAEVWRS